LLLGAHLVLSLSRSFAILPYLLITLEVVIVVVVAAPLRMILKVATSSFKAILEQKPNFLKMYGK
jgi:hypothetical protein